MDTQGAGIQLFLVTYYDLARISLDLDHVERRARGHAQSLALAHGEVMNAAVLADDFAVGGNQFTRRVRQGLALLRQVCVEKLLVVPAGNETDFLRVRLLSEGQSVLLRQSREPRASSFRRVERACG